MRIDLKKGTRFGRLVLTWEREVRIFKSGQHVVFEKCVCDCWNTKWIRRSGLNKWTKSCWCLWMETIKKMNSSHRMTESRFYKVFSHMKTRCNNPKEKNYKNYWWRWIKCLWNSFEEFRDDMYESYVAHVEQYWEKNTSIDRIDVNWNYCKENCRWATPKEQWNNQRTNTVCIINWETHNLGERAEILWIPETTLKRHLVLGKIKWEIFTRWTWKMRDYKKNKRWKLS